MRRLSPLAFEPAIKLHECLAVIALGVNRRAAVCRQMREEFPNPLVLDLRVRSVGFRLHTDSIRISCSLIPERTTEINCGQDAFSLEIRPISSATLLAFPRRKIKRHLAFLVHHEICGERSSSFGNKLREQIRFMVGQKFLRLGRNNRLL